MGGEGWVGAKGVGWGDGLWVRVYDVIWVVTSALSWLTLCLGTRALCKIILATTHLDVGYPCPVYFLVSRFPIVPVCNPQAAVEEITVGYWEKSTTLPSWALRLATSRRRGQRPCGAAWGKSGPTWVVNM